MSSASKHVCPLAIFRYPGCPGSCCMLRDTVSSDVMSVSGGDEEVNALGKATEELLRSEEGREFFHRLFVINFCGLPYVKSQSYKFINETKLLESESFRTFAERFGALFTDTRYGGSRGVICLKSEDIGFSRSLEYRGDDDASSIGNICRRLRSVRSLLTEIDRIFLVLPSEDRPCCRHRREVSDVHWDEACDLFENQELDYESSFRNAELMKLIGTLEQSGEERASRGSVEFYLGGNLLQFLCYFVMIPMNGAHWCVKSNDPGGTRRPP